MLGPQTWVRLITLKKQPNIQNIFSRSETLKKKDGFFLIIIYYDINLIGLIEWVANNYLQYLDFRCCHYWHPKNTWLGYRRFFFPLQIKREKHMHILLFKRQLYLGTYFRPTRDLSIQTVSIWLAMVKFGRQLIFSGQPTAVHYGNMGCQVSMGAVYDRRCIFDIRPKPKVRSFVNFAFRTPSAALILKWSSSNIIT